MAIEKSSYCVVFAMRLIIGKNQISMFLRSKSENMLKFGYKLTTGIILFLLLLSVKV